MEQAFSRVFRDFVGRIVSHKPDKRSRFVISSGHHLLYGLAQGVIGNLKQDDKAVNRLFDDYLAVMGKRSESWEESKVDAIASEEIRRAVGMFLEKAPELRSFEDNTIVMGVEL